MTFASGTVMLFFCAISLTDSGIKLIVPPNAASSGVNSFAKIFSSTPLLVEGKPFGIS